MPWNETTRKQYSRKTERYESDLIDVGWALPDPLLPPSCRLGRPRQVELRDVVNSIACMLWTGCSWRALLKDFPAFTTVQTYFYAWSRSGVLEQVCARFTTLERLRSGRSADPSAAIIDSQSVPTVEAGSEECGNDAGKTIKEANGPITVEVTGKPRDTKGVVVMSRRWGGRMHLRIAAPLPAPLQRLRVIHRQLPRLAPVGSKPCSHHDSQHTILIAPADQTEGKPLEEFRAGVGTDCKADILRAGAVHHLEVTAIESGADGDHRAVRASCWRATVQQIGHGSNDPEERRPRVRRIFGRTRYRLPGIAQYRQTSGY